MLVCMDIGNTNICIGIYENDKLLQKISFCTKQNLTADEYGIKFMELLYLNNIERNKITGFIISSVVPKIDLPLKEMIKKYFNINALFVGQDIESGIKIRIDNPKQLGADLLVGAVGAVNKYGPNVLIIDIGTAMTFSYVNQDMEFLGGSILPGMQTAFSSLVEKTSKLESVGYQDNIQLVGKDTKTCIQSGMVYGWSSIIEGMIEKYQKEYSSFSVVMTGGEAKILSPYIDKKYNIICDDELLLDGLKILYFKNVNI